MCGKVQYSEIRFRKCWWIQNSVVKNNGDFLCSPYIIFVFSLQSDKEWDSNEGSGSFLDPGKLTFLLMCRSGSLQLRNPLPKKCIFYFWWQLTGCHRQLTWFYCQLTWFHCQLTWFYCQLRGWLLTGCKLTGCYCKLTVCNFLLTGWQLTGWQLTKSTRKLPGSSALGQLGPHQSIQNCALHSTPLYTIIPPSTSLYTTIHYYTPLYITIHHYTLYTTIHYTPYTILYKSLYVTLYHFKRLYASSHPFSSLYTRNTR